MVATLVLVRDENGDLYDQEGHLRNAAGHRLDDQRAIILDHDADAAAADAQAIGMEIASQAIIQVQFITNQKLGSLRLNQPTLVVLIPLQVGLDA
ncbi:hypothetical protein F2Q68_00015147 [Brassica cretica]|uniref:Uncharacterized protein n=1 Tax=Brassica cretica TaxID=69181 RepID=A0A8S9HKZ5_BRACR|nr:hypothetical protein F2Q68_00015147 [Brassica cretica]